MAIRDRLRKKFGSKKGSGDSTTGSGSPPRRTDIEYYKPHEIPKSKYRGKVDKAHQEKLDAYSLGDAFMAAGRRASQALSGSFSPGGTQSQSRRTSYVDRPRSILSVASAADDTTHPELRRKSVASAGVPREDTVLEKDSEYSESADATPAPNRSRDEQVDLPEIRLEKTITAGRPTSSSSPTHNNFTLEQLEQAMTRSTLRPRRGTVIDASLLPQPVAA